MDIEVTLGAAMKAVEQLLTAMNDTPEIDGRAAEIARTHFETAFLWVVNGIGEPLSDGQ